MNNKVFKIEDLNLSLSRKISKDLILNNKQLPLKIIKDNKLLVLVNNEEVDVKNLEFFYSLKIKKIEAKTEEIERLVEAIFIGREERLFESLINKGISLKASDIHFEPREKEVLIRYRIDGKLVSIFKLLNEEYERLLSEVKIRGNMDITEKRRPQDGKINFKTKEKNYNLRLSTIPILKSEKLVIRILYSEVFNYDLKSLDLEENIELEFKDILKKNSGVIIINGPTGSGKSTTLYSILKEIKDEEINITTLEDPIEIEIEGINQMSLNRKANITFANGLRNILRQDPDVIMIGEIRDEETAKIAVTASLTGHKVLTTIHTKAPEEVFLRLKDMGIKDYLIKDSLNAIISQRLVRILCNKCKVKINDEGYEYKGCLKCNYTGYKGRKIVISIVNMSKFKKKEYVNIFQEISEDFRKQFIKRINNLYKEGLISLQDLNSFILEEALNEDFKFGQN